MFLTSRYKKWTISYSSFLKESTAKKWTADEEIIIGKIFLICSVQTLHRTIWSLAISWAFLFLSPPILLPGASSPPTQSPQDRSPEESHIIAMDFGHCHERTLGKMQLCHGFLDRWEKLPVATRWIWKNEVLQCCVCYRDNISSAKGLQYPRATDWPPTTATDQSCLSTIQALWRKPLNGNVSKAPASQQRLSVERCRMGLCRQNQVNLRMIFITAKWGAHKQPQ